MKIEELVQLYNGLGYIFRSTIDPNDSHVKSILERMITDPSDYEIEYIEKIILKDSVKEIKAPYNISLRNVLGNSINVHIYIVKEDMLKNEFDKFDCKYIPNVFDSTNSTFLLFLDKDYIDMDPNVDYEDKLKEVIDFYISVFECFIKNCQSNINSKAYPLIVSVIFASLFIIQTLDQMSFEMFEEAYNKLSKTLEEITIDDIIKYVSFRCTLSSVYSAKDVYDLCNKILEAVDCSRGNPYLNTFRTQTIADILNNEIPWTMISGRHVKEFIARNNQEE